MNVQSFRRRFRIDACPVAEGVARLALNDRDFLEYVGGGESVRGPQWSDQLLFIKFHLYADARSQLRHPPDRARRTMLDRLSSSEINAGDVVGVTALEGAEDVTFALKILKGLPDLEARECIQLIKRNAWSDEVRTAARTAETVWTQAQRNHEHRGRSIPDLDIK